MLVGLASLVLLALAVAGLVLPPLFVYAALNRGHRLLAVVLALGYLGYLFAITRRLVRARPPPRSDDGPD